MSRAYPNGPQPVEGRGVRSAGRANACPETGEGLFGRRLKKRFAGTGALLAALLAGGAARAGSFDAIGAYRFDPGAAAVVGFETAPERFLPDDAGEKCMEPMFTVVEKADAIEGGRHAELRIQGDCAERFLFALPAAQASYRATVWMRHGGLDAAIVVAYAEGSGLDTTQAQFSPTGRTTSDGWVELATNDFPVDGPKVARTYLRVVGYAADDAVEIDGLEVVPSGTFVEQADCEGFGDPVCGPERTCIYGRCALDRLALPVLPADVLKNDVVDVLESQLRIFYGGRFSRLNYLPTALAKMETMRGAKTAWEFWSTWGAAIHALHDWHTSTHVGVSSAGARHRLNVCFIEGDADLSQGVWPKDPKYADILVSHVGGADNAGLKPGDRLIAVDGQHPIAWARSLADRDWSYGVATDPGSFADFAEGLGGPTWGHALLLRYAKAITVLRCDPAGTCAQKPEVIPIASLGNTGGGSDVACDNRPLYHLEGEDIPSPDNHYIFGHVYRGRIAGTTPEEAIFGMTWDTLYGGGNPNGGVNSAITNAINEWKAGARGVILDHRAGNGGTLDAPTNLTRLVRPPGVAAVMRSPIELGAWDGPFDTAEGLAIFEATKNGPLAYPVGANDWAEGLPVALIIHRDGSASDYLPYGMKGAPHTRIFGPHQTAGAFSTYINLTWWAGFDYQFASGDTVGADGSALIGHGVEPDVTLLPRQSDLVAGKDTLFEAALAWVRQELKP